MSSDKDPRLNGLKQNLVDEEQLQAEWSRNDVVVSLSHADLRPSAEADRVVVPPHMPRMTRNTVENTYYEALMKQSFLPEEASSDAAIRDAVLFKHRSAGVPRPQKLVFNISSYDIKEALLKAHADTYTSIAEATAGLSQELVDRLYIGRDIVGVMVAIHKEIKILPLSQQLIAQSFFQRFSGNLVAHVAMSKPDIAYNLQQAIQAGQNQRG